MTGANLSASDMVARIRMASHQRRRLLFRPEFATVPAVIAFAMLTSTRESQAADRVDETTIRAHADVPDTPEFQKRMEGLRPRLILDRLAVATLRSRVVADPIATAYLARLRQSGLRLLDQPPVARVLVGTRLTATTRRILDRISTLGLLYLIDDDPRWASRAVIEMRAVAAFPDFNPQHFLDVAECTHALAIGLDWMYPALDTATRTFVRTAIVEKGLRLADQAYRNLDQWVTANDHWNAVCNAAMITGACAVAELEPELAHATVVHACASIRKVVDAYGTDGGWADGPGFWDYTTGYLAIALSTLEAALGSTFGLGATEGVASTALYRIHTTGASGLVFNYGDCADRLEVDPAIQWLGGRGVDPWIVTEGRRLTGSTYRPLGLVWLAPVGRTGTAPALDRWFQNAAVVCLRSAWDDPAALYCGIKGGDNATPHAHLDLGTFVLDALGQRWAIDLGGDDPNLPEYLGRRRHSYYRVRTEGHNTLVLDGQNQDKSARAPVISFVTTPTDARVVVDLTDAYAASGATRVHRGVGLIDTRRRVLVQDEIQGRSGADLLWSMHTQATVTVDLDQDRVAVLSRGNARLEARILAPENAWFAVEVVAVAAPQRRIEGVRKLTVQIPLSEGETRIAVLFTPITEETKELGRPVIQALETWAVPSLTDY